jgi:hypothetical protein
MPRNPAKKKAARKAKVKPMSVWVVMSGQWPYDAFRHKRNAEKCKAELLNDGGVRVVEFREVRSTAGGGRG